MSVGAGTGKLGLVGQCSADVIGLDWKTDMGEARQLLGRDRVLQGNVDPMILFAPEVWRSSCMHACCNCDFSEAHALCACFVCQSSMSCMQIVI